MSIKSFTKICRWFVITSLLISSLSARAQLLDLLDEPLFISTGGVVSNVLFVVGGTEFDAEISTIGRHAFQPYFLLDQTTYADEVAEIDALSQELTSILNDLNDAATNDKPAIRDQAEAKKAEIDAILDALPISVYDDPNYELAVNNTNCDPLPSTGSPGITPNACFNASLLTREDLACHNVPTDIIGANTGYSPVLNYDDDPLLCEYHRPAGGVFKSSYSSVGNYNPIPEAFTGSNNTFTEVTAFYLFDIADNQIVSSSPNSLTQNVVEFRRAPHYYCACLNLLAYNPNVNYEPWVDENGTYSNANFFAAKSNPVPGTAGFNIEIDLSQNDMDLYTVPIDPAFPAQTSIPQDTAPQARDISLVVGPNDVKAVRVDAAERQNYANWFQYHRRRSFAVKGLISRLMVDNEGLRYGLSLHDTIAEEIQADLSPSNILNRDFNFNGASPPTIYEVLWQAGYYYSGNFDGLDSPIEQGLACQQNYSIMLYPTMLSLEIASALDFGDRDSFKITKTTQFEAIPDDQGVTGIPTNGDEFVEAQVVNDNFTLSDKQTTDYNFDNVGNRLADVATYWYKRDLRPDFEDNVIGNPFDSAKHQHMVTMGVAFGNHAILPDEDEDRFPETLQAEIDAGENPFWADKVTNYANPTLLGPTRLYEFTEADDLWQATFDSKGVFTTANSPDELSENVSKVLENIIDRAGSAAAVAVSSSTLRSDSLIYQARFDSGVSSGQAGTAADNIDAWTGQLRAYRISPTGSIGDFVWDAGCTLTGQTLTALDEKGNCTGEVTASNNLRKIFTSIPGNSGGITPIPFRWNDLSAAQKSVLREDLETDVSESEIVTGEAGFDESVVQGQRRVDYIRGSKEFEGAGNFRVRSSVLGDIIHSNPLFVEPPRRLYPDNFPGEADAGPAYSSFKSSNSSRASMVYVGSNDGMLHAFQGSAESNGAEVFAYIPTPVFKNLHHLSYPFYSHKSFVDGPLVEGDVVIGGSWKTYLVGALRHGGQGVYALDITNPVDVASEDTPGNIVKWEFTDRDDADLGYTYGSPQIVRMANGKWAALVSNGYNSTESDGNAGTGVAALYVLYVDGPSSASSPWAGSEYVKISTGEGNSSVPNGLSSPFPVDTNGDYKLDLVYAGDLNGNIWRFDVSSNSSGSWTANKIFSSSRQTPITSRPSVGPPPSGFPGKPGGTPAGNGVMVYFGTGKYLEAADIATGDEASPTQSIYGIWDKLVNNSVIATKDNRASTLHQQTITNQTNSAPLARATSNSVVDYSTKNGWYIDLIPPGIDADNEGERMVNDIVLRNERVFFTTIIPSSEPCDLGGSGWVMVLDSINGSRPPFIAFDLNGDGAFDNSDKIASGDGGGQAPASGFKVEGGIPSSNTFVQSGDKKTDIRLTNDTTGGAPSSGAIQQDSGEGRYTWRRLK